MKINVILNLLSTYFSVSCPRDQKVILMEIKVSLRNVPMPCDQNIKYNLLLSLKTEGVI